MTNTRRDDLLVALINGLRAADPDVSAWEIANSLYLTEQIRREQPYADVDDGVPASTHSSTAVRGDERGARESGWLDANRTAFDSSATSTTDTDSSRSGDTSSPGQVDAGLYADVTAVTGQRARRVRTPGGRALSDPLGVMRALRPLMRRVPSRTDFVLDVDATVQHAAEAQVARVRVWSPILRPRLERWLSIDLVCDASASMRPWREMVDEFRALLERSGGFRAVRSWRWDVATTLDLRRDNSPARRTLPGASDERLILVVSDCLHDSWRDQRAVHQLADWAHDNPLALMQVLPEYLWDRTALAALPAVMAHQSTSSRSNRQLRCIPLLRADEDILALLDSLERDHPVDERTSPNPGDLPPLRPVPIPIVTLDPTRLLPWARMVAGRSAPAVRAVLATPQPPPSEDETTGDALLWIRPEEPADVDAEMPETRVRRLIEVFRGYASPGGRRLATCLTAVAPVTLSIMRVVRDALVKSPSESHIAELLMSGFFEELPDAGADPAYVWAPGVHEQLSLGLTASDFAAVTGAVTQWMGARTGSPHEMTALLRDPAGAERMVITDETRPFAYLYANNLRRLHMTDAADRLTARAAEHVRVGSPEGLDLQRVLTGHAGVIFRMSWSPDGRWLLTPSVDGSIRLWDGTTGSLVDVLRASQEGVNEIAWLKGGTRFAAAGHDGYLRLWDITSDGRLSMFGSVGPHYTDIHSAASSPDGTRVAIGCENGLVTVYADTGREPHSVSTLQAAVPVVAWSADGALVIGDVKGNVLAFDIDVDDSRRTLKTDGKAILSLSTSRYGAIAIGDADGDIFVWTGSRDTHPVRVTKGGRANRAHTDVVSALAFSPDGLVLASKGMDACVRFWRTDTWALIAELHEPNGNFVLAGLAWHPTLPLLATLGDHDRAVRIWQVDMDQLLPVPMILPRTRQSRPQPRAELPALEKEDIQSPILRRRPAPYIGCHILLHFADGAQGREFLRRLLPHIISAAQYTSTDTWAAVALTYTGLKALGLPDASLDSFPTAFREGMAARASSFEESEDNLPQHWEAPYGTGHIHAALTLLSISENKWQEKLALARRELQDLPAVQVLKREDFAQLPSGRTPFGYKDGISFPNISGNDVSPILSPEAPIAAGEFVLGYPGDSGRTVPMPHPEVLGRNGTFVGFRKMHSKVAAFRRFLRDNAVAPLSPDLLAAKMIGRWPSGAPLMLAPDDDRPELGSDLRQMNNFLYGDDPKGLRCPLGSHIRRMNPRDTQLTLLDNVNLHRIIRHSNAYGPPLAEGVFEDDGQSRGIFFIFLSASAPETYEFLKKHWIEDGSLLGLETQRDPIAGSHGGTGTFTIPMRPLRRRIPMLESFTRTLGGEYGFMPGLSALNWISELKAESRNSVRWVRTTHRT